MAKKIVYSEPDDYIPKDIRKKYQLGEYSPEYIAEQKAAQDKDRKTINDGLRKIAKK